MDQREEFERTIVYGEAAIGHLKANEMAAYPRYYEVWYTYAVGFNQALNRAINDLLRERGRISAREAERLFDMHLSPFRLGERVEHIGDRLSDELRSAIASLNEATGEAASFGGNLREAQTKLEKATFDSDSLRAIVQKLIAETRHMEQRGSVLEAQLVASRRQIEELQISLDAIRSETLTDPLTNLGNRKCFDQTILRVIEAAVSSGKPFSLLLADIDNFKKFNDAYGHQTGDQVLRLVASAVRQSIKGQDTAVRYGGEEFAIILPRTPLAQALAVAEHIREAVTSKELIKRSTGERLGRITVSIGCAMWSPGDTVITMIERADAALYRAKHLGRNRVCSDDDLPKDEATAVA